MGRFAVTKALPKGHPIFSEGPSLVPVRKTKPATASPARDTDGEPKTPVIEDLAELKPEGK